MFNLENFTLGIFLKVKNWYIHLKLIVTDMYVTRKYYIHDISTIKSYMDIRLSICIGIQLLYLSCNILINAMNITALSMLLLLCIQIHLCSYSTNAVLTVFITHFWLATTHSIVLYIKITASLTSDIHHGMLKSTIAWLVFEFHCL